MAASLPELTDYQSTPGNTAADTFSLKFDEKSIAEIMPNHSAKLSLWSKNTSALQAETSSVFFAIFVRKAQWSSQNEELSCLMEILATPFQDSFVCRAKVTQYYPRNYF